MGLDRAAFGAALLAGLAAAACSTPQGAQAPTGQVFAHAYTVVVEVESFDTAADVAATYGELAAASHAACPRQVAPNQFRTLRQRRTCQLKALNAAVAQADRPALDALHAAAFRHAMSTPNADSRAAIEAAAQSAGLEAFLAQR